MRFKTFISISVLLWLSPSLLAESDQTSFYHHIYVTDFDKLFDQSSLDIQDEDALERHFLNTKALAVIESAKWNLAFFVTTGLITYFSRIYRYVKPPTTSTGAATVLSSSLLGIAFFMDPIRTASQWIQNFIQNTCTSVYQYAFGISSDNLETYERRYVRKKPQLAINYQRSIEDALRQARTKPDDHYYSKLAPQLIDVILSLPTQLQDAQYNRTHIDRLFNCYSPETQTNLRRLIVRHVAGQKKSSQRQAIFFKGPPGTGKTRAARLVAEALLAPYREISLADVTKEDFVGNRDTSSPNPGLMLEAMTQTNGIKNFVLVIDEADRVLNKDDSEKSSGLPNFMLLFLDPNRRSYYNEFLKTDIDISDITIILAGNHDIQDEALRNRLHIVPFDKISQTCKHQIVWEQYFPEILSRYQESKFQFQAKDFTDEDRQNFNQIISNDTDPGMRSIYQRLEHYIEDLIIDKIESHLVTNI